jgi:hypothetical protein
MYLHCPSGWDSIVPADVAGPMYATLVLNAVWLMMEEASLHLPTSFPVKCKMCRQAKSTKESIKSFKHACHKLQIDFPSEASEGGWETLHEQEVCPCM